MSYANPIWLEGRRKYWTRPDAYRSAPPDSPEARMPGWLDPWMTRVRAKEAAEDEARARAAAEQEEYERALLELRWLVKSLRTDLALRRLRQKYSPAQPRVSAGSPEGGQWTNGGGDTIAPRDNVLTLSDEPPSSPAASTSLGDSQSDACIKPHSYSDGQ